MKVVIQYHYVKSDHLLAIPEFDHEEIIEYENEEKIEEYILSQTDEYGHPFEKKEFLGFDYISNQGGIKIIPYIPPTITTL